MIVAIVIIRGPEPKAHAATGRATAEEIEASET